MATAQQQADWRKRRILYGPSRRPALGTQRRIQALFADGWTMIQMENLTGVNRRQLTAIASGEAKEVFGPTAEKIAAAFETLAGRRPTSPYAARNRTYARQRGWVPAFCWDNIEDPHERAKGARAA